MGWKCPEDWKYVPKMEIASDETLVAILFCDHKRWQETRVPWFRRCNASGKWIWPFQKAWFGVVATNLPSEWDRAVGKRGSYSIAWLNQDQFIIQRLKGNI